MLNYSQALRKEIVTLNAHQLTSASSTGYQSKGGTILFKSDLTSRTHGNFIDASYDAILKNLTWQARLCKPHQQRSALPAPYNVTARKLDSSNSSDALLMNIFCYPGVMSTPLAQTLKVSSGATLEFGFKAGVPLTGEKKDSSEVDLKIDDLLIEAKFTEADFTFAAADKVQKYSDFASVFDDAALPKKSSGEYESYQLIRNILAAHQHDARFLLLCDERRPDLVTAFKRIHAAISLPNLQARCGILLWQEISRAVPQPLADYLADSRGIR